MKEVVMFKASSLANAVTLVVTTAFFVCGLLSNIAPDFFWNVTSSLLHAISIESIKATEPMEFGTFLAGIVFIAVYVWIIVFAAASLYNRFTGGKTA